MPQAYLVVYAKDGRRHRSPLYPSYTLAMTWASNHLKMKWLVFGGRGMHPFQIIEKQVTKSTFDTLPRDAI